MKFKRLAVPGCRLRDGLLKPPPRLHFERLGRLPADSLFR
jgi:hypothetical protein